MTTANAFSRPDGAWLLSDTAHFRQSGAILLFGSKVVASERLSLALCTSGRVEVNASADIEAWLAEQPGQTEALDALPDLLRRLESFDAEAEGNGALVDNPLPSGIRLTVAWWDCPAGVARTGLIANIVALAAGAAPYTLRPAKTIFSPSLPDDPWPGHSFDPVRDAVALAQEQRRCTDQHGIHRVGGTFEALRVHAGGVDRVEVTAWPDEVGWKIEEAL